MPSVTTSIKELSLQDAEAEVAAGAVYIDLRKVGDYLDVHIPGSVCLQYEYGPGMPGRARDCIPLDVPFVLLDDGTTNMHEAAAAFRGKGFAVPGYLGDGVTAWGRANGTPASTDARTSKDAPDMTLLSVGDPGSVLPKEATLIPIEELWDRVDEIADGPVAVIAGRGVRAAIAVGLLERAGRDEIVVWRYER